MSRETQPQMRIKSPAQILTNLKQKKWHEAPPAQPWMGDGGARFRPAPPQESLMRALLHQTILTIICIILSCMKFYHIFGLT